MRTQSSHLAQPRPRPPTDGQASELLAGTWFELPRMIPSISSKSGKPKLRGKQGKTTTVEDLLRGSDFEKHAPSKIRRRSWANFPKH